MVIPAEAGIQEPSGEARVGWGPKISWAPAFAGETVGVVVNTAEMPG